MGAEKGADGTVTCRACSARGPVGALRKSGCRQKGAEAPQYCEDAEVLWTASPLSRVSKGGRRSTLAAAAAAAAAATAYLCSQTRPAPPRARSRLPWCLPRLLWEPATASGKGGWKAGAGGEGVDLGPPAASGRRRLGHDLHTHARASHRGHGLHPHGAALGGAHGRHRPSARALHNGAKHVDPGVWRFVRDG